MTREEAIYCLKSYQPDAPDDMCLKCPYYGSVEIEPNVFICKAPEAREMAIKALEQEPKIGHWIMIDKELQRYKCSECGEVIRLYTKSEIPKLEKDETLSDYLFSHCGCRMFETQESEG